ncbi:uncharacterized protein [Amphiura filiformis]|uniref:uncharacterized protein isoform X1 n=1 Tax=Amphiura filiformis TaxID=82378 RepID=UPI003B213358
MLLGATIFALVLGTAISAPYQPESYPRPDHYGQQGQQIENVLESVHQGFLCNWCVVAVEDGQTAISENLNEILGILNRTSQLCAFCPVQDQCSSYFMNDVPAVIEEFLAESPEALCNEAALCDTNNTLPMPMRSPLQSVIRTFLGENYLCETCQDFISTTRDIMQNNETQYEIMEFIAPLCTYMPTEYQAECNEFVQSIPSLMTMIAKDVLLDSTCTEIGFCKEAKKGNKPGSSLPDIVSQLASNFGIDLDRDLGFGAGNGQGRSPFQIPEIPKVEIPNFGRNPIQFPGQGRPNQNPFGLPDNWNPFGSATGRQQPEQGQGRGGGWGRPGYGQTQPGQQPEQGQGRGGGWGRPGYGQTQPGRGWGYGQPQQPAPNARPQYPKPRPEPAPKPDPIPDFNLEDIWGKTQDILGQLPDVQVPQMPEIPRLRLPTFNIKLPGFGRKRRAAPMDKLKGVLPGVLPVVLPDKVKDVLPDMPKDVLPDMPKDVLPDIVLPDVNLPVDPVVDGVHHEYVPDPIPDAGITITEQGAENCEICKMAVIAVDNWLQDNAAQLQKMVSQFALPFCTVFPSPMKQDCVSDVSNFVETFIQVLVSKLQPDSICTMLGQCDASAVPEVPAVPDVPYVPTASKVPRVEPTTWPIIP